MKLRDYFHLNINVFFSAFIFYLCISCFHIEFLILQDSFKEERDVILTLKDKPVLDEEQDTLINVNIVDDERYKKVSNKYFNSHRCTCTRQKTLKTIKSSRR